MLAQTVVCPSCRAELKIKPAVAAGMTSAPCPKCGATVPIPAVAHPPSDTDPSVADRTQRGPGTLPVPIAFHFLAPPKAPDELGRLGPYRVLAELGRGGMGVVFRAEDPVLKRQVALKVMLPQNTANPADKARFLREARAQAQVDHEYVAQIYQVGEDRGVAYLAMPLLRGQSLADALKVNPKVPLSEAIRIAREIAEGLAGAHEKGLVHRDIKPGNIWLEGKYRRVKILDFGLARPITDDAAEEQPGHEITRRGAVIGTPAYMSPEQARGEPLDHRSDLFSLGTVLYQMLAGRQPFRSTSGTGILIAVATETPPRPGTINSAVPQALDSLVMALLEKNPDARPASADHVAEILRAIEAALSKAGPSSGNAYVVIPMKLPSPDAAPDPWSSLDATETDGNPLSVVKNAPARPAPLRLVHPETPSRRKLYLTAGLFAMAVVGALLAISIYLLTAKGTVTVEINDAEVESRFRSGKLLLLSEGKERYAFTPTDRTKSIGTGTYTARLDGADGVTVEPREITVKRGEKVIVRLALAPKQIQRPPTTLPPVTPPPTTPGVDPDRKAADYVISVGGTVRINGETRNLKNAADLPREPFRLTFVDLTDTKATDLGLTAFQGCKNLYSLFLTKTLVTDAGLAHFKDCTDLTELWLMNTQIGDAGLIHFKDCKRITSLNLFGTNAGDDGIAVFKECRDELTFFNLSGTKVSDKGLAHYKGCKGLTFLNLSSTKATNEGLANFKECKNLTLLWLNRTDVTDDGLASFGQCSRLRDLSVGGTKITDAALAHFANCREMTELNIWATNITDAGLVHVANFKNLALISVTDTKVGDAGLAHLKGCTKLTLVFVFNTQITDEGVRHLANCKSLTKLNLWNTRVTNACIDVICGFEGLTFLDVRKTKITAAGHSRLKKALPKCDIPWDDVAAIERAGAEYVLSLGGSIRLNDEFSERKAVPAAPFALTWVSLFENKRVTDAGLAAFRGCENVKYLSLSRTGIGDAALANFSECKKLTHLHISRTQVTDAGVAHFNGCTTVISLGFGGTAIGDEGLANFKSCENLNYLHLWETQVTDAGLAHFANRPKLLGLGLSKTRITDAGLVHFKDCKNLTELALGETRVTDAGLAHFADCTKLTMLYLGGSTAVGDAGIAAFRESKKLAKLTLWGTKVTDAGLATFAGFEELTELSLADTKTSDAGLAHFKDSKFLSDLNLSGTQVTDAGLAHLKAATNLLQVRLSGAPVSDAALKQLAACKRLTFLDVRKTMVTEKGVDELHRELPRCRIEWDGGVILPKP